MSQVCLLAAGLLTQVQAPGLKLPVPPSVPVERSAAAVADRLRGCSPVDRPAEVTPAERHQPEFSVWQGSSSGQTIAASGPSADRQVAVSVKSLPVVPQAGGGVVSAPQVVIAPTPLTVPALRPYLRPEQVPELTSALLPQPAQLANGSAPISGPRPTSGAQLYQQRAAALRAGSTYTRMPPRSFQSAWANATVQPTYEQWVSLLGQEAQAMARGQGSNRLSVMVGDSLSLWFPPERLTGDRFWLNQGISGDTTAGVLHRLSAFRHANPDTIHVMVGINDLRRGATDQAVLSDLGQIMQRLRQAHPQAQIFVHSLLPTRLPAISASRIRYLNQQIAALTQQEQVSYLELQPYFADGDGNLRQDLTTDGLHLNPRGYAVWQWALAWARLA